MCTLCGEEGHNRANKGKHPKNLDISFTQIQWNKLESTVQHVIFTTQKNEKWISERFSWSCDSIVFHLFQPFLVFHAANKKEEKKKRTKGEVSLSFCLYFSFFFFSFFFSLYTHHTNPRRSLRCGVLRQPKRFSVDIIASSSSTKTD